MPLKNAYPPPLPGQEHQKLTGRVSVEDHNFLHRLLPYTFPINDIVVSTLFKKFIDELRHLDAAKPFGPTLFVGDDNYTLVERVLEQCQFGDDPRRSGARDVERTVDGVRETVQPPAEQCADEKSSVAGRKRGQSKKSEGKKG